MNRINRRQFLGASAAAATLPVNTLFSENAETSSPNASTSLNPSGIRVAGIQMIPVVDGKYKVWTKRVGRGKTKVLLLHGGPAFTHNYLEAMESFLPDAGIEMYYYDQLGCGNSDIPEDTSLWTLDRYCEEVEEVRRGLGWITSFSMGNPGAAFSPWSMPSNIKSILRDSSFRI